jgi:hypothetical protein
MRSFLASRARFVKVAFYHFKTLAAYYFLVLRIQGRYFLPLLEERTFPFCAAFSNPRLHDNGYRQAECLQAYQARRTHEQSGPGVGKDEHGDNFVRWQME